MLIYNLPDAARSQWDRCVTRCFDIGYDSGEEPWNFRSVLHPDTVKDIAELGASITITIYPCVHRDGDAPEDRR